MITINTVNDKYFELDGVQFAMIYQPLAQGSEALGIYSIYDTRKQLVNSTKFNQFSINSVVYDTLEETIEALLPIIWLAVSEVDIESLDDRVDDLEVSVANLEQNQYTGVEVYPTLADLPVTGTLLVSYKVSNDTDYTKNGYYHWTGAVYVKDADLIQGATYKGVASVATVPDAPVEKEFYLAVEKGIYTNFDNIEIDGKYLYVFTNAGLVWSETKIEALGSNIAEDLGLDITGERTADEAINTTNGLTFASIGSNRTDYIPCSNLKSIFYTGRATGSSGIAFYDEDKAYLSDGLSSTETIYGIRIEVPATAYYLRASSRETVLEVLIISGADSHTPLIERNKSDIEIVSNTYNEGSYSSYNTGASLSETEVLNDKPILAAVGDYVEIELKINKTSGLVFQDILNLLLGNVGTDDRCGFFSLTEFWFRVHGDAYVKWTALTENFYDWNTIRLEVVAGGWEFFVNNVSKGVLTKYNDFEIAGICKQATVSPGMEAQRYDIAKIDIHTSVDDFNYNELALYKGSENIDLVKGSESEMLVSWDLSENSFLIYQKDKQEINTYYMFEVWLETSEGEDIDPIFYSHKWEIKRGSKCIYDPATKTMTELEELLAIGESEFTMFYTDPSALDKTDHTGGVHGDERIDKDIDSFVYFYINGNKLTAEDLAADFTLKECYEFRYAQRSTLHDTAIKVIDKDTGLPDGGAGVLTINGTSDNFEIDAVDTGIKAYSQNGILTSTSGLTVGTTGTNFTISEVNEIIPANPIIGEHYKDTVFENQGYKTTNTIVMNSVRQILYAYFGICSLHKDCATLGYNEDFEEVSFSGGLANELSSNVNRLFKAHDPTTRLSCDITSEIKREGTNILDSDMAMFVWDRVLDSKYYRKSPAFVPVVAEKVISEMIVKYKLRNG